MHGLMTYMTRRKMFTTKIITDRSDIISKALAICFFHVDVISVGIQ